MKKMYYLAAIVFLFMAQLASAQLPEVDVNVINLEYDAVTDAIHFDLQVRAGNGYMPGTPSGRVEAIQPKYDIYVEPAGVTLGLGNAVGAKVHHYAQGPSPDTVTYAWFPGAPLDADAGMAVYIHFYEIDANPANDLTTNFLDIAHLTIPITSATKPTKFCLRQRTLPTTSPISCSWTTRLGSYGLPFSTPESDFCIPPPGTALEYAITATAGSNGNISPQGTIMVIEGNDQTFTFTPDTYYEIDGIEIDGLPAYPDSIVSETGYYTFVNVDDTHNIHVTYKENSPVIGVEIVNCPENGYLYIGNILPMEAQLLPYYVPAQNVTWKSSNPNTAIVDQDGNVKAMSIGATTITVTTLDGFVAECYIKVIQPVTGIKLNKEILTLSVGATEVLKATVLPATALITDVLWSSSDTTIATVDVNGKVTGIVVGEATITATTVDGGHEAHCAVTVTQTYVNPTSITINPKTLSIDAGSTFPLIADVQPAGANPTVTWSSSAPNIATVDATGLVTALAAGKATITAKTVNNYSATCAVTVTIGIDSILITPDVCTIPLKGAKALKATVFPANATNKTIAWSSSDATIATVSTTGTVTAKSINGVVEIYATNVASGKFGVCVVTVGSGKTGAPLDTEAQEGMDDIIVYPNPTNGIFYVSSSEFRIEDIEIFDVMGKMVIQNPEILNTKSEIRNGEQPDTELNPKPGTAFDLSNVSPGVYFIRIKTENGMVVRKIVKQ